MLFCGKSDETKKREDGLAEEGGTESGSGKKNYARRMLEVPSSNVNKYFLESNFEKNASLRPR